jgi:hypothetical protein
MNASEMIYAAAVKSGLAARNTDGSVDLDAGQFIQFLVLLNRKYALLWKEDIWVNQKIVSRSIQATAQVVKLPADVDQVQTARLFSPAGIPGNFREIDEIGLSRLSPSAFMPATQAVEISGYFRIPDDTDGSRRIQIMPAPHASQYPLTIELTAVAKFVPLDEDESPLFAEDALFSFLLAEMYEQTGEIDMAALAGRKATTALQIEKDRENTVGDRENAISYPASTRNWSGD